MIKSMTGYGEAEGDVNGITYVAEIRTVNNRYLKTVIRLPDGLVFLEQDIEKLLRTNLSRGTVNYALRVKNVPGEVLLSIDEVALRSVIEKLGRVAGLVKGNVVIDLAGLVTLPGIMASPVPDEEAARQTRNGILRITEQALDRLKQMRSGEGAALRSDIEGHCKAMKDALEQIRVRNSVVLSDYQRRLKQRVDELLLGVDITLDEATLAREVAIYAERSDISEEVARLDYHIEQFVELCRGGCGDDGSVGQSSEPGQIGRRLEFISQEMLREANTMASKASTSDVAALVIDIKCRIDRLKEQVQNVE